MSTRFAAGILISSLIFGTQAIAEPSLTADQIFTEVEKRVSTHDEAASVKMVIFDANGSKKERELEIKRKADGRGQKVMVKLESPADLRGTSLLSVSDGPQEDQWLYLPSSKQTRRILSSKKSNSFLDSELTFEDLGTGSGKKFSSTVAREDVVGKRKFAVIESKPRSGDSSYSKILTWVSKDFFLIEKIEYYDMGGKLLKVSLLDKYKKYGTNSWRAQRIQVRNMQTKRATVMNLSKLEVNKGLDDHELSQTAMAEEN